MTKTSMFKSRKKRIAVATLATFLIISATTIIAIVPVNGRTLLGAAFDTVKLHGAALATDTVGNSFFNPIAPKLGLNIFQTPKNCQELILSRINTDTIYNILAKQTTAKESNSILTGSYAPVNLEYAKNIGIKGDISAFVSNQTNLSSDVNFGGKLNISELLRLSLNKNSLSMVEKDTLSKFESKAAFKDSSFNANTKIQLKEGSLYGSVDKIQFKTDNLIKSLNINVTDISKFSFGTAFGSSMVSNTSTEDLLKNYKSLDKPTKELISDKSLKTLSTTLCGLFDKFEIGDIENVSYGNSDKITTRSITTHIRPDYTNYIADSAYLVASTLGQDQKFIDSLNNVNKESAESKKSTLSSPSSIDQPLKTLTDSELKELKIKIEEFKTSANELNKYTIVDFGTIKTNLNIQTFETVKSQFNIVVKPGITTKANLKQTAINKQTSTPYLTNEFYNAFDQGLNIKFESYSNLKGNDIVNKTDISKRTPIDAFQVMSNSSKNQVDAIKDISPELSSAYSDILSLSDKFFQIFNLK